MNSEEKAVKHWCEADVCAWLCHIAAAPADLLDFVHTHAIDGCVLLSLSEQDIEMLPLQKFGHRRLLMLACKERQIATGQQWPMSASLTDSGPCAAAAHVQRTQLRASDKQPSLRTANVNASATSPGGGPSRIASSPSGFSWSSPAGPNGNGGCSSSDNGAGPTRKPPRELVDPDVFGPPRPSRRTVSPLRHAGPPRPSSPGVRQLRQTTIMNSVLQGSRCQSRSRSTVALSSKTPVAGSQPTASGTGAESQQPHHSILQRTTSRAVATTNSPTRSTWR